MQKSFCFCSLLKVYGKLINNSVFISSLFIWIKRIRKRVQNNKSWWLVLQFRGIAVSDAGRYLCRARNSAGEAEAVAEVVVSGEWTSFLVETIRSSNVFNYMWDLKICIYFRFIITVFLSTVNLTWAKCEVCWKTTA
jgi:hypothetical protein